MGSNRQRLGWTCDRKRTLFNWAAKHSPHQRVQLLLAEVVFSLHNLGRALRILKLMQRDYTQQQEEQYGAERTDYFLSSLSLPTNFATPPPAKTF